MRRENKETTIGNDLITINNEEKSAGGGGHNNSRWY